MKFMICTNNKNYELSLELWKVYEIINDDESEKHNLIRIIDESGEDYLYPLNYFMPINLPKPIQEEYAFYKTRC